MTNFGRNYKGLEIAENPFKKTVLNRRGTEKTTFPVEIAQDTKSYK